MSKVANFDYKYDYNPVLLWQYSNSPNIKSIVANEQEFVDTAITGFIEEFNSKIFNLETCDTNGLDLWGRMLGVQRPMFLGEILTDSQYRLLLQSRFALLTWDGSAYGLTKAIKTLFPTAIFRVVDNLDMSATIEFAGGITEEQEVVLRLGYIDEDSGEYVYTFLPRPAGVNYNINFDDTWATTLGFEGMTETTNMGDDNNPNTGGVFYK